MTRVLLAVDALHTAHSKYGYCAKTKCMCCVIDNVESGFNTQIGVFVVFDFDQSALDQSHDLIAR